MQSNTVSLGLIPKVEITPGHSTPIVALRCTYCGAPLEAKKNPPWTCEYCDTVFVGGPDSSQSYYGDWERSRLLQMTQQGSIPERKLHEILGLDEKIIEDFQELGRGDGIPSGFSDDEKAEKLRRVSRPSGYEPEEKKEKRHLFWPF